MKLEIKKYNHDLEMTTFSTKNSFVLSMDELYFSTFFSSKNFGNYDYLYEKRLIPSFEDLMKKFNAYYDSPFLFKNEKDAEKFLEYLEPIIIMETLTEDL